MMSCHPLSSSQMYEKAAQNSPQIQKFYTFPAEYHWHKVSVTALAATHACIMTLVIILTVYNNGTQYHLALLAALEKHLPGFLMD